jgi:uncharacterized membrane protein
MSMKPLWHQHPHVRSGRELTLGERAADRVKRGLGSWTFIFLQTGIVIVWIIGNLITLQGLGLPHWDPYPFILLNLAFSTQAAYSAPILQLSNNRSDRQASELALSTHSNGEQLLTMNKQQLEILTELRQVRALLGPEPEPDATPPPSTPAVSQPVTDEP